MRENNFRSIDKNKLIWIEDPFRPDVRYYYGFTMRDPDPLLGGFVILGDVEKVNDKWLANLNLGSFLEDGETFDYHPIPSGGTWFKTMRQSKQWVEDRTKTLIDSEDKRKFYSDWEQVAISYKVFQKRREKQYVDSFMGDLEMRDIDETV